MRAARIDVRHTKQVDEQTEQIKSLEQSSSSSSTRGERIQPKKTESYDIQQLQKRKRALEREMEAVEKELHESQAKMDQLRSAAQGEDKKRPSYETR